MKAETSTLRPWFCDSVANVYRSKRGFFWYRFGSGGAAAVAFMRDI